MQPPRADSWAVVRSAGLGKKWLQDLSLTLRQTTTAHEAMTVVLTALKKQAGQNTFQRGLVFASLILSEESEKFACTPPLLNNKYDRKTALAIWKYISRATVKTSPFSHFTTVNALRIADLNNTPEDHDVFEKAVATPNVALLPLFYEALLPVKPFRDALKLRLNPSLESSEHSIKWLYFDGETEAVQQAESNPALAFILEQFNGSSPHFLTFSALSAALKAASDTRTDDADALIFSVLDIGLLEPEWPVDGYSPSWCGALYQYLGFLPNADDAISEAAYLLQWLRTAARTLPHQPIAEARQTMRDAHAATIEYFNKKGLDMPLLTPEGLFYEDVSRPVRTNITPEDIAAVTIDLQSAWQDFYLRSTSNTRAGVMALARKIIPIGEQMPVEAFYQKYLLEGNEISNDTEVTPLPFQADKIGALLQFFEENGQIRAVVNALFPGGEKMAARWRHLFPEAMHREMKPSDEFAFSWHGWSNANFQPAEYRRFVLMPGSRRRPDVNALDLNRVAIRHDPQSGIGLVNTDDRTPIVFYDAGLESVEEKPPFARLLWWLGTPDVSLHRLTSAAPDWRPCGHWEIRERFEYGLVVLMRRSWRTQSDKYQDWVNNSPEAFMQALRHDLEAIGLPEMVFLQLDGNREKPQLFMLHNPLCYMDLQKKLKTYQGSLIMSEMLPGLSDNLVQDQAGEMIAAEWVIQMG